METAAEGDEPFQNHQFQSYHKLTLLQENLNLNCIAVSNLTQPTKTMTGKKRKRTNTSKSLITRGAAAANIPSSGSGAENNAHSSQKKARKDDVVAKAHNEESLYFHDGGNNFAFEEDNEQDDSTIDPLDYPEPEQVQLNEIATVCIWDQSAAAQSFGFSVMDVSDSDSDGEDYEKNPPMIVRRIVKQLKKYKEFIDKNAEGSKQLVQQGHPLTVTEFSQQLHGAFSQANLEATHVNNLLGVLRNALPNVFFPSRQSKKGNNISDLSKYVPPSRQLLEFGACPNDCCVYIDSVLRNCKTCAAPRYKSIGSNVNAKSLFYRSISATIIELLHYPFFLKLLSYHFVRPSTTSNEYKIMDILDGENAKRHLASMRKRFQSATKGMKNKPIEVNILVSLFYDGIQLFRKKQENYWPLFCTILNLPPAVRTKIGAGMFMLTAFYGSMDSATETFIFEDCLIKELQVLRKGLLVTVDEKAYFIQVYSTFMPFIYVICVFYHTRYDV